MPNLAACRQDLTCFLKARIPFIALRSDERDRAIDLLRGASDGLGVPVFLHTLSHGTRDLASQRVVNDDRTAAGGIEYACQQILQRQNLTFVLTEVQGLEDDSPIARQLLDAVSAAAERGGTLVVITTGTVWSRLQRHGMGLTLSAPDEDEMREIITRFLEPYRSGVPIAWGEPEIVRAATILSGVTRLEAENALATLIAGQRIDATHLEKLGQLKDAIFTDISGLERVRTDAAPVGGLVGLRTWLERQRPLLTMDLRQRHLRPPRGILLVGVPGCGKSLSAKAIATGWGLPLYRLDLANIHGMYLGQSEGRLKEALATADRLAPCVLWIDEIEKGLAGGTSGGSESTARLIGHFLYWLQESPARVFVVATANDISRLPPELTRRGRFDEIFFVDLPTPEERQEIIALYAQRFGLVGLDTVLTAALVEASDQFAGADVVSAMQDIGKESVIRNTPAIEPEWWLRAFRNVVPLAKTSPEAIDAIRAWGVERAVPASGAPIAATPSGVRARRMVLG